MLKQNYEIEVLVNGKPLKEYLHQGKAYIEGREGTTFSLRFRNSTGSRKLFIPSIDGLSVMDGEKASFDSSGYIVRPYSSITVQGWRISDDEVNEFYFSSPKDAYASRTKQEGNLGVIGVAVFSEKEQPKPIVIEKIIHHDHCHDCQRHHPWGYPHIFYSASAGSVTTTATAASTSLMAKGNSSSSENAVMRVSQDLGTGWGELKRSEVVSVDFERESHPSSVFEIFYNTREQLEAIGVDFRKEPLYVTPQAFPGQYCKPPIN